MKQKNRTCPFCFADVKVSPPPSKHGQFPVQYCEKCGSKIPPEILDCRLFPIAVVGPSGSGKTHFLTVLAHLLCEQALWPDYWEIDRVIRVQDPAKTNQNEEAEEASDDDFLNNENKLYPASAASGTILNQTDSRSEDKPPLSLVIHVSYVPWRKNFKFKYLLKEPIKEPRWDCRKNLLLAFTDTAGEDLRRMGWDTFAVKYPIFGKKKAEGIIALVNPTQLKSIRDQIETSPEIKTRFAQSGMQLSDYTSLESVLSIPEIQKPMRRKPLAVCLTKINALISKRIIDSQDILATPPSVIDDCRESEGVINKTAIQDISNYITDIFLPKMDQSTDIEGAARKYRYRAFFATDALGSAIETATSSTVGNTKKVVRMFKGRPQPRSILEPLLWLLWQHGLVGGKW